MVSGAWSEKRWSLNIAAVFALAATPDVAIR
jgi:hypothetical protein